MFRGFRWQFIALLIAVILFAAGLVYRAGRAADIPPRSASPTATPAPAIATEPTAPTLDSAAAMPIQTPSAAVFREGLVGSLGRLNPLFAHLNPVDADISSLIFEGLFAINDYGEVVPRLAADLVISSDGLEYVVILRDDIKWQNGMPFSADDVVYTMGLLSEADEGVPLPNREFWRTVETQKLTEHLLRFRLAQPFSSFPYLLTIGLLPEHALRGTTAADLARHPFNLSPIGTGAFQLGKLVGSLDDGLSAAQLLASPVFSARSEAAGGYFFREIWFQLYPDADAATSAFLTGELDAMANPRLPEGESLPPDSRLYAQTDGTLGILIFNWNVEPFAERRLRQALSLSLNVPQLVAAHLESAATYADSPYPPGAAAYQPQAFWNTYDPAQAQSLLDDAAATEGAADNSDADSTGADAWPGFTLLLEDRVELRSLGEAIAAQWRLLGLDVSVEAVGAADLQNRLETGRFDAALVRQHIGADPDLFRFWHPAQHGSGWNYGAASDVATAELLEFARAEIYGIRRAHFHQQFQLAFAEGAIARPVYYPLFSYVLRDTVEGVQLGFMSTAADRFRGIQSWGRAAAAA